MRTEAAVFDLDGTLADTMHMHGRAWVAFSRRHGVEQPEERFLREFILQLKLGRTDRGYFRTKYGEDPALRFQGRLDDLAAQGFLRLDGDEILVSREGLLQIDRLLPGFFLPEHRDARDP